MDPRNAPNLPCRAPVVHLAVQVTDRAGREHQHQFMLQAARNVAQCRCPHPCRQPFGRGPRKAPQVARFVPRRLNLTPGQDRPRPRRQRIPSRAPRRLRLEEIRALRGRGPPQAVRNSPFPQSMVNVALRAALTRMRTAFATARAARVLPTVAAPTLTPRTYQSVRDYRRRSAPVRPPPPCRRRVRRAALEAGRRIRDQMREEAENCSCSPPQKKDVFAL